MIEFTGVLTRNRSITACKHAGRVPFLKVPTLTGQDSPFRLGMASVVPARERSHLLASGTGFLGPETDRPKSPSGKKRSPPRAKRSRKAPPIPGFLAVSEKSRG